MADPNEFTGNLYIQPKPRQAVKVDPTDDAHMTTHQPPMAFRYKTGTQFDENDDGSVSKSQYSNPIGPGRKDD